MRPPDFFNLDSCWAIFSKPCTVYSVHIARAVAAAVAAAAAAVVAAAAAVSTIPALSNMYEWRR